MVSPSSKIDWRTDFNRSELMLVNALFHLVHVIKCVLNPWLETLQWRVYGVHTCVYHTGLCEIPGLLDQFLHVDCIVIDCISQHARACSLNRSIILSKRRAIVEPRCLSRKHLKYQIEIWAIELIWLESRQTSFSN